MTTDAAGRPRRISPYVRFVALPLAVVGCLVAAFEFRLVGDAIERNNLAAFYAQPAGAADGAPGSLIRGEELIGVPFDARAWRIMYRTTDVTGMTVVSTGVVIAPLEPPTRPRTVLAWGHPTTGTAADCAPSRSFDAYAGIEGLRFMLDRSYVVAATSAWVPPAPTPKPKG